MSQIKNHFHDEIEMRAMFDRDSNLSEIEAFEILAAEGIAEIEWSTQLNNDYQQWIYLTIK